MPRKNSNVHIFLTLLALTFLSGGVVAASALYVRASLLGTETISAK